jgi:hypothetical protein
MAEIMSYPRNTIAMKAVTGPLGDYRGLRDGIDVGTPAGEHRH